jgi:hypothetical protein
MSRAGTSTTIRACGGNTLSFTGRIAYGVLKMNHDILAYDEWVRARKALMS